MICLSRFTPAVVWLAAFAAALAQEGPAVSPDEQALQDAAVKFVEAYNAKDAAAIAALFVPQARMEEADGTVIEGREAIQAAFAAAFEAEPAAQISLDVESLTLITPDVAVEQGATVFFPDGETLTSRGRYIVVHLKQDGAWRMASARSLEKEVLTNYEHLRQLDGFVGDWIDEDADAVVETTFRWDEGRNFLLQEFQVRQGAEVVLKGTQRLGWDPQAKQIRGWIFDSAGGFGESRWTNTDGAWTVTERGVAADGANTSSTRTLTPLGDRVDVQIANRIDGGALQPDVQFTMVRRAPAPAATAAR